MNTIVKASADPLAQQFDQNPPNPLMLIPREWVKPAAVLWTTNQHLIPSPLALCSRLRIYEQQGLTADDLQRIVAELTKPERAATHRFAADLLADLSQLTANVFERRRMDEQSRRNQEERQREEAEWARRPKLQPGWKEAGVCRWEYPDGTIEETAIVNGRPERPEDWGRRMVD
jgi:hypothetical protein